MIFVADALGGWLVGQLADAGRKKLTELVIGSEQERALRRAADVAVWATAEDVDRSGGGHAEQLAMVISEVFRDPVPDVTLARPVVLLEGLQARIAGQLAVLDDAGLTGTGQSSADVMGVPGAVLADRLTGHLVREVIVRGSGGGPLAPLADQFNHELTRLHIGGMLAQLATEVRGALARPGSAMMAAGRPLEEVTDPFLLEVHRPVEPGVPHPELPVLPVYVPRGHDAALAKVVTAAAAGRSGIAVLVGGSSTGKTRACWQALELLRGLEPGWSLWHPIDAVGAMAGLPGVQPRTVVWLNEAQRYLDAADGTGEGVAARFRELLREPGQRPVLVLVTLWPQFWDELTVPRSGGADPHAQARELLTGQDIAVPAAFTPAQLRQLERAGDPRLAQAVAGSRDGQVIQYLAGAPELLDRYHNAPPAIRALINAGMDAARLGIRTALPRAFLEMAAPGYLTDAEWDLLPSDWLEEGLGDTARPAKGVRGPLAPVRPRRVPGVAGSGDEPPWHLADYLDQHGRRARRELIPPEAFWAAAAAYVDPADLATLAQAAENRGLYRDAARLYKKASGHGNATAGTNLVRLLRTLHSGDQRPADWVAAHASLDDPPGVIRLLDQLRAVGANGQVAALGRRAAAHIRLDHPSDVTRLLDAMHKAGDDEGVRTLLDRDPAAHAGLDDAPEVARLLDTLRKVGATGQVTTLLDRDPAAHASLDSPGGVARLLETLHRVGATGQVTELARRAAAHASLGNLYAMTALLEELGVTMLLDALRSVGATGQVTELARRAAAHASLDDLDSFIGLLVALGEARADDEVRTLLDRNPATHASLDNPRDVANLLLALHLSRATGQVATLASRVATHTSLDNPSGVARMLGALNRARAGDGVRTLLERNPAARTSLDDPSGVARMLDRLDRVGATGQVTTLLGRDPAAAASLKDPTGVANLLVALREVGAIGQVTILLGRDPAAHVSLDDPVGVARLLDELSEAGATGQVTSLTSRVATQISLDDPVGVATILDALREVGATGQVTTLLDRDSAAHINLDNSFSVERLLNALRRAGRPAAELIERLPAAGLFHLFCSQEGHKDQYRFGREPDGRTAKRWTWTDLG